MRPMLDWVPAARPRRSGLPSMPRRPRPVRPYPRLLAALVALCVLLSGIAPGVSRALAATAPAVPHDLCVADGARPANPPAHHGGGVDEPACPLCAVHGGTHAAPPPAAAPFGPPPAAVGALVRAEAPCVARGGWIAAAPRGPPVPGRSA